MTSSMVSAAPKKYGYVPPTFPRDPAEVNQFAEHIVLGQILEPMVDTDKMGNVTPGLAESWSFEDKGFTIKFKIRKDRFFSNGKKLEAKDMRRKMIVSGTKLNGQKTLEVLQLRRRVSIFQSKTLKSYDLKA